ncbi:MAG: hypothetical protein AABW48_03990 [Nanoarchaeota archaeon]
MVKKTIEQLLGLTEAEIKTRTEELKRRIPTIPGTDYLKVRLAQFEVQPWPFVTYLAHYCPEIFEESLNRYADYDGAENYQAVKEQLCEYYIMGKLWGELLNKKDPDKY